MYGEICFFPFLMFHVVVRYGVVFSGGLSTSRLQLSNKKENKGGGRSRKWIFVLVWRIFLCMYFLKSSFVSLTAQFILSLSTLMTAMISALKNEWNAYKWSGFKKRVLSCHCQYYHYHWYISYHSWASFLCAFLIEKIYNFLSHWYIFHHTRAS